MRPRKTPETNCVYVLQGGNEDNDLHAERATVDGEPLVITEWDFSPAEREAIAVGGRVQLILHTHMVPPIGMCAVLRASSGDVTVVEQADATQGTAVVLPAQADRLRKWLAQSVALLEAQETSIKADAVGCSMCELARDTPQQMRCHHSTDLETLHDTMAEMADLIDAVKPLEERARV